MRRSDEAFNAGKEIEAMKRLTLHRIAFVAQLCTPALRQSCEAGTLTCFGFLELSSDSEIRLGGT